MKSILITGVAGFIGSKVADKFLKNGYNVIGVDDLSSGSQDNVPHGVKFILGDLSKKSTILKIPSGCEKILHLAGQSSGAISFDDPVADLEKNTVSTINLIEYGIKNNSERIVYASSMSVYGDVEDGYISETKECKPLSCYGVSKLSAEEYLRIYQKQLPYVSLRMFNVFGPGQNMDNLRQGMVSIFLSQALNDGNILVKGSINRFRDFIYIDDVVEVWFRAAISESVLCQTLNVGTGVRTSIKNLLDKMCEKIDNCSYYVDGFTLGDQTGIFADTKKLKKLINLKQFVNLDDGVDRFITWASNKEGDR
jgi:UDP-glucose 4-epimerase